MFVRKNAMVSTSAVALQANVEAGSTLPNIDGDALAARAVEMAGQVGEECDGVIASIADAKEIVDLGKFRLLFAMQSDIDEDTLNEFPIPDSESGNNPDKFKADKINKDGTTSKAWTTFYTIFADGTEMGKQILSAIEMLTRAGMPNAVKTDIPAAILELNPHERETKLAYWIGRRGTLRKAYKEAMKLYFKFQEVNEYPGIKAEPIWETGRGPDDGHAKGIEVANTTKPIQVWLVPEEGKPVSKWEAMSVGAFMKLNPKKATEKGGTFQNLIESGVVPKSKAGTGATAAAGQNEKKLRIETSTTLRDVFVEAHRSMTDMLTDKQAVEYGKFLKLMNEKDNDEVVTSIVELRNYLNDVCRDAGLDKKYVKLQQAGSELVTKAN